MLYAAVENPDPVVGCRRRGQCCLVYSSVIPDLWIRIRHWYASILHTCLNKTLGYNQHSSVTDTNIFSCDGECTINAVDKYMTQHWYCLVKGTVTKIWYIDFQTKLKYFQVFIYQCYVNNTKFNFQLVNTKHIFNEGLQGYRMQVSYTSWLMKLLHND